jgi:hypothetical protein
MNYFLLPCEIIGAAIEVVLVKASAFLEGKFEWM